MPPASTASPGSPRRWPTSGRRSGSTSTRSPPATSPPKTPDRCAKTPSGTRRSRPASRRATGATPRRSPAARCSWPRRIRITVMAPSSTSTAAGSLAEPGQPAPLNYAGAQTVSPPPWYASYRWLICGLLFFATTVNYVDRAVFGVLGPTLRDEFGWTATQFGDINAAFTLAYAIGFIFVGWFIDRVGTRWGYTICLIIWSIAAAGHALARGAVGFMIARFALGIGESGNFPAAIKTTAEWFPKKERATATGIFNAGSNIGAIVAPAVVPFIAITWGWQAAFIITGLAGLAWVAFWMPLYRKPAEHP